LALTAPPAGTRTVITGGVVVTQDAGRRVIRDGVVVIDGATIAAIGPASLADGLEAHVIDARGCAVIPGLINAHTHLYNTFGRTLGADQTFAEWLPAQKGLIAQLGEDEWALRAARDLGARYLLARGYTDRMNAPEYLETLPAIERSVRALVREHHGAAGGRLQIMLSPMLPWARPAPRLRLAHARGDRRRRGHADARAARPHRRDVHRRRHAAPARGWRAGRPRHERTGGERVAGHVREHEERCRAREDRSAGWPGLHAAAGARSRDRGGRPCPGARPRDRVARARQAGGRRDVDIRTPFAAPVLNVVTALVSSSRGRDVRDVLIDGRVVVRDHRLATADGAAIVNARRGHRAPLVSLIHGHGACWRHNRRSLPGIAAGSRAPPRMRR
jgi:hypothetical protein